MAKKHTHKYYFGLLVGGDKVWACALPNCTHYMPKHMEGNVEGKFALCWKCSEQFTLDPVNMKRAKPICDDCTMMIVPDPLEESPDYIEEQPIGPGSGYDDELCIRCKRNPRTGLSEFCVACFMAT